MTFYDAVIPKIFLVTRVLAYEPEGGGVIAPAPTVSGDINPIKILPPTGMGADITVILNKLYNFGIWAFGAIFIMMIAYAGFQMLTAQGNSTKLTAAWNTIKWAAIGYGVYLMAGGIVSVLLELISGPVTK